MRGPSLLDLKRARVEFERREPRDLFYRAATELVDVAWTRKASLSVADAVAVLLQTWNQSYYRFHGRFDGTHFDDIEAVVSSVRKVRPPYRNRTLVSLDSKKEGRRIGELFERAELVLGPVGAAKALHLLAPRFFPLWDRKIADRHGVGLTQKGKNGSRYVRFMEITKHQVTELIRRGYNGSNVLKAIDEYNYCRFTKGWLTP